MKKMFHLMLAALTVILLLPTTAHAACVPLPISSAAQENVCYIETVITDTVPDTQTINAFFSSQTITKTKTTYCKNAKIHHQADASGGFIYPYEK